MGITEWNVPNVEVRKFGIEFTVIAICATTAGDIGKAIFDITYLA